LTYILSSAADSAVDEAQASPQLFFFFFFFTQTPAATWQYLPRPQLFHVTDSSAY
jgi:hypothetical protein